MPNSGADWTGNTKSVYAPLGASNHSEVTRAKHDYYATDPRAMELLLEQETFSHDIWECACGEGHLSKVLINHGYNVRSTDLIYRGYGENASLDFLQTNAVFSGDIITNPPYKFALEFVKQALKTVTEGHRVAMFLKLQFLEGKERKKFFAENPPEKVYVSSSRLNCALNGDFTQNKSSAVAYAWFLWVKGVKRDPIVKWIN